MPCDPLDAPALDGDAAVTDAQRRVSAGAEPDRDAEENGARRQDVHGVLERVALGVVDAELSIRARAQGERAEPAQTEDERPAPRGARLETPLAPAPLARLLLL